MRCMRLNITIAMTGDISLFAGGHLDNSLYILFCQLTSFLVDLSQP